MAAYQSELAVITKAKDLCSYVMTVTDKSPKRFRFTLVAKLQSYALNTIESLYRANEVFVKVGGKEKAAQRLDFEQPQIMRTAQKSLYVGKYKVFKRSGAACYGAGLHTAKAV